MHIPMALIADEANLSQEGKLNVLGAFDRIVAPGFPMIHPKMVFIIRIEAGYADSGRRVPVRIRLMDEDGEVVFNADGEIGAPQVEPGGVASTYQIFGLAGVGFRAPGMYKFVVNLGDHPPHETALLVSTAPWAE